MPVTIDGNGVVTAGGTSTSQGQVVLGEDTDNGSNTVTIQAPASLAANRTVTMPDADINFATGLGTSQGGTGLTSFTTNGAVYATSTSALTTGTLPVASGGTGAATLTSNNVILGNGTSAVQFVAPGTNGNVLTSNGTTWTSGTPSSTFALLTSGTITGNPTTVDVETGFTDTGYELILIYYENITCSSLSGNPSFRFRIGGAYNSSSVYTARNMEVATSVSVNTSTSQAQMVLGAIPQITTAGTSFAIIVQNRFQGARTGAAFITNPWWGHQNDSAAAGTSLGFIAGTSGDVQGLRFFMTGGAGATQFSGGTFFAYGIKTT